MKTVYCVQYTINSGHHNTYANLYCEVLLGMGYSVVLLTPQPRQDISAELYSWGEKGLFFAVSMPEIDPPAVVHEETTECSALVSWKSLLKNKLAPVLPAYYKIKYRVRFAKDFLAHKIMGHGAQGALAWPRDEHIALATNKTGLNPDFVFFLYIDDYLKAQSPLLQNLNVPWSGILFYTTLFDEFFYPLFWTLRIKHCHGLCMLDERKIAAFRAKFPAKKFVVLPDVGFFSLPSIPSSLCLKVQTLSKGRHIILLAGALAKRKGILTLLKIALMQQKSPFFFVFCGKIDWDDFRLDERAFLNSSINAQSHNIYWHTSYLEDERELNALCSISDVLYAVYEGTDGSSGILSKAAYFSIPIVVAEKGLMAREVQAGPMGEVTNPHNMGQIFAAVQRAIANRDTYHYDAYIQKMSRQNLANILYSYLA